MATSSRSCETQLQRLLRDKEEECTSLRADNHALQQLLHRCNRDLHRALLASDQLLSKDKDDVAAMLLCRHEQHLTSKERQELQMRHVQHLCQRIAALEAQLSEKQTAIDGLRREMLRNGKEEARLALEEYRREIGRLRGPLVERVKVPLLPEAKRPQSTPQSASRPWLERAKKVGPPREDVSKAPLLPTAPAKASKRRRPRAVGSVDWIQRNRDRYDRNAQQVPMPQRTAKMAQRSRIRALLKDQKRQDEFVTAIEAAVQHKLARKLRQIAHEAHEKAVRAQEVRSRVDILKKQLEAHQAHHERKVRSREEKQPGKQQQQQPQLERPTKGPAEKDSRVPHRGKGDDVVSRIEGNLRIHLSVPFSESAKAAEAKDLSSHNKFRRSRTRSSREHGGALGARRHEKQQRDEMEGRVAQRKRNCDPSRVAKAAREFQALSDSDSEAISVEHLAQKDRRRKVEDVEDVVGDYREQWALGVERDKRSTPRYFHERELLEVDLDGASFEGSDDGIEDIFDR